MNRAPRSTAFFSALGGLALIGAAAGAMRAASADSTATGSPKAAVPADAPPAAVAPAEKAPPAEKATPESFKEAQPKQRYVVAAIGDSLTDARSHGGKFLAYLKERCPASQFDNYGKGGQMVNQMQKRFARDVLGEPAAPGAPPKPAYTHVIVFGGVNDLYSDLTAGRTPKKIAKDLSSMYEASRARGMRVVALTVAPWGGFTSYYNASRAKTTLELNQWIRSQEGQGKVDFVIDTYPMLSCGDPERLCPEVAAPFKDGLHFGPEGHNRIGKALYEKVFSSCL
jgi:lysophospholipase L1-like esterase